MTFKLLGCLSLRCPVAYKVIQFAPDDGSTGVQTWGQSSDGSAFAVLQANGTTKATAAGPLWDAIEAAYAEWHQFGRPARERLGVTADRQQQWVWLDDQDNAIVELDAPG